MSLNIKRHRTPSQTSVSSSTSTLDTQQPSKASRTTPSRESTPGVSHPLLCTLPPTCNHRPTPIANTRDLETHYATYHAHVCEQHGCGSVFPDARLLELHQTECHDPLAAVRKDRGEKIFACHLPSCPKLFLNPKARRLHLIQAHGYPKEFFFAVTNKGVGGLLKRWGEGVSLIRKEWKSRDTRDDPDNDHDNEDSEERDEERDDTHDVMITERSSLDNQSHETTDKKDEKDDNTDDSDESLVDGLANNMGSLTLVPPSIRFGRGGKNGGFVHNTRGGGFAGNNGNSSVRSGEVRGGMGGRGRGWRGVFHPGQMDATHSHSVMDIDPPAIRVQQGGHVRGGLGWAGRGRAGIVHIPSRGRGIVRGRGIRGRGRGLDTDAAVSI